MKSSQPGLTPQVTRVLNNARLLSATVLVNHYYDYCYYQLMRETSTEETIYSKETYDRLEATRGSRVCSYRTYNGRFSELLLKEAVHTCEQQISYCGVGSHQQNAIFEHKNKELTLGIQTLILILPSTRLWPEVANTRRWLFSFKASYQS